MTKEEAINQIHEVFRNYYPCDGDKAADEVIKVLSEPSEDAISRKTVLDLLGDEMPMFKVMQAIIRNLPSV